MHLRNPSSPVPEKQEGPAPTPISGVPRGAEAIALIALMREHRKPVIFIATSDRERDIVATALAFFAAGEEILHLPAWDCLPYDRVAPHPHIIAERLKTLAQLAAAPDTPRFILTTVNAALQKLPPRDMILRSSLALRTGSTIDREALIRTLVEQGYRRSSKVIEQGEFAVRGSIIDILPPGEQEGLRLDLFGDTLEHLRRFDPLTQASCGHCREFVLHPACEIMLSEESITRFREGYRAQFGAVTRDDPLYEAVSQGRYFTGMEHWLPLFYPSLVTLADYAPRAVICTAFQAGQVMQEHDALTQEYYDARCNLPKKLQQAAMPYHPLPPQQLYLNCAAWQRATASQAQFQLTPFAGASGLSTLSLRAGRVFTEARATPDAQLFTTLAAHHHALSEQGKQTFIACYSEGSRDRIRHMLGEHRLPAALCDRWEERARVGAAIGLCVLPLEQGFETADLALITEQDLLGERIVRTARKKRKSDAFMAEVASFVPGELVVHREHGIGRFEGLVTLEVSGTRHDCLKLIYEGNDKLFLPVENSELVSRFGSDEEGVTLDKLGGAQWQARKARMKERITLAAEALMKIAAERALKTTPPLEPAAGAFDEFCARFPYMETEDQARSIEEVLDDLARGAPMDRLICGDVGFGKTEVALRAAFVAASTPGEGGARAQVALVCPTTLLARQHYRTFRTRFDGLPFTVRSLSRLVPAREAAQTREMLAEGTCDIVIGTHALLSKNIQFKQLGLLIVDEEQHFGVAQKEKLKEMKAGVHVLTLSATPIPRTLQLSLSGVRDLSLITTPPVDRLAVRTFVMPFDPVVLREAVMREYHRGGKIFCVTPRIKDLAELRATLAELVPEIKITVAHGQMAASELDGVMNDFYDGKADLLLSTAIIESGIDIPTANTLIVHHAHLFGLSQLYQLRGRVGRGKTRAYAYFTLPHHKMITPAATRRLEVMQSLDTLGAGFTLASHDMDIRGFGNLVGEQQSGHIREVGVELYQQMLEEAVEALKHTKPEHAAEPQDSGWSPQINLGMSVLIPESYVADLELRLALYRRAAMLKSDAELDGFAAELVDRFGPLPGEVTQFLAVMHLKLLCRLAGIEKLDAGPKGAVITLRNNLFSHPEALLAHLNSHKNTLKLRPDQKIMISGDWTHEARKLRELTAQLKAIAALKAKG